MKTFKCPQWVLLFPLLFLQPLYAAETTIAVAANFTAPMQKLVARFQEESGHIVKPAYGSTGKFFTQIENGAPFDVLLSADQDTPERLEKRG